MNTDLITNGTSVPVSAINAGPTTVNTNPMWEKYDLWEPEAKLRIEEAADVDGKHVLGKVVGDFFVPDGTSRNQRYYPKTLWEKVVQNSGVRRKLTEKLMFGTIGHGQKLDDVTLLEGKMSHIVTNIRIEGNRGIGEALILDTPAGRVLNTILRAGSVLRVSSRANGSFKGEMNGIPVVDPDTYALETFDFVIDPGFFQANPKLVESLEQMVSDSIKEESNFKNSNKGDVEMDTKLVENLAKENGTLKVDLEKATTEMENLKNESVTLRDENKHLKFELEKVRGFKKVAEDLKTEVAKYKELGTVEEMLKLVENVEKFTKETGSFADVKTAMKKLESKIREYRKIGSAKSIDTALERAGQVIEEYKKRGSLADIDAVFARSEKMVKETKEVQNKAKITALSKELGVSEEKIAKLWGKMEEKELREFFKGVQESNKISHTFKKSAPQPVTEEKKPESVALSKKSRGTRLMESFGV